MSQAAVERRRPTPADRRFRRAIYVMLVALGVIAASALINARDAHRDAQAAERRTVTLQSDNQALQDSLGEVTAALVRLQETLVSQQARNEAQREALRRQIAALEDAILSARDVTTSKTLLALAARIEAERRAAATASPSRTAAPRASPAPTPVPTKKNGKPTKP
jgi:cell division septation protein DedD